MSAETVRLLHLVLDKLDRLADKGDEADWRAVAAIILEETRDDRYHPRPARLREILTIVERHMIKEGFDPNSQTDEPSGGTRRPGSDKTPPAPDALGERAPSPVAGMETTAEQREEWLRVGKWTSTSEWILLARAARDIARLTAELAVVTPRHKPDASSPE